DQVGERVIEIPQMIEVTNAKDAVAKEKLKEAHTHQKSYADKHRRSLEFQPEDEHVLPVEEQPLHLVVSPTAESLRYVVESDPEKDPEEYEDDESEDSPVNYPMDRGDDGDNDDGDPSRDDADDEDEDEVDEEEEEEHLASADSAVEPASISLSPEAELRETGRRRQAQMVEILRVMRDMKREIGDMHAELLAPREQQRRAR
nr:putative nucleotidyltransferase, ribonuclease H [Tanacetum cinerariifolium]